MNKKLFLHLINALKKQEEHDNKFQDGFGKLFHIEGGWAEYDNKHLQNAIWQVLQTYFPPYMDGNKKYCDIEYFIYDLEYGTKYKKGCLRQHGKNIDISTAEKLYDYLTKK